MESRGLLKSVNPMGDLSSPVGRSSSCPDWATIDREILCPMCDYNLRGLTESRCPECGYRFDWPAVLDPNLQTHPYLFEVHPERYVRSFLRTLVRGHGFWSFWKSLQPSQRSSTGRLAVYGIVCGFIALLPAILLVVLQVYQWHAVANPAASFADMLTSAMREWPIRGVVAACLIWALFPWLNFLALRVFAQSMRQARVKPIHVLRCAVYCGDLIVWNAIIDLTAVLCYGYDLQYRSVEDRLMAVLSVSGAIMILLNFVRLASAYRFYMKFPHVIATIAASQVMVALAILVAVAYALYMF